MEASATDAGVEAPVDAAGDTVGGGADALSEANASNVGVVMVVLGRVALAVVVG